MDFEDGELDTIRADMATVLLETSTIERSTLTRDTTGGTVETWAAIAVDVPCSIVEFRLGGGEAPQAGQPTAITTWIVTYEWGTDVTVKDRILASHGRVLEVTGVDPTFASVRVAAIEANT